MLIKTELLTGYTLHSLDGEIGKVVEFYFDDQHWAIRYLVANTGNWLTGKQVLLSPYALGAIDMDDKHIRVDLTKKQIEDSPSLNSDMPVSHQFEVDYYAYYGWPMYWSGRSMWGYSPNLIRDKALQGMPLEGKDSWDPNLRSMKEVSGYAIHATDGEIGHAEDFIIDTETWAIRYLVIDTNNWWPGQYVLVAPQWIDRINLGDSTVFVNLTRDSIKDSPGYEQDGLLTREYEDSLHRHYNLKGYWTE